MTNPTVAIFSSRLLPASETFIRAQGEGLQQFSSYYVGLRLVEGLPLPSDRSLVVNQGGLIGTLKEGVFKFLGLNPKLYREIRRLSPKLIHAHFGISGALALPLAKGLQVPLVVTFHGSDATMKDEYARRASYSHRIYLHRREALKKEVKLFIAVSHFIKEKLLSQGYPSDKIEVHYIGVDREAFQPDPAVTREPVVLFVGRLVEKKGCEYLIRAMGEVQKVNPNVELVVIGDGPSRPRLEELAANQLKRCKFLGIQPPGVVHSWMNRASLLAAP
ncbi:MAG TPA: glycosyltransferase, partial [Candidatus Caenarcaniphilales bacterium]